MSGFRSGGAGRDRIVQSTYFYLQLLLVLIVLIVSMSVLEWSFQPCQLTGSYLSESLVEAVSGSANQDFLINP